MPLSIGGGVKSIEGIRKLLENGADKVIITTEAVRNPQFISDAAQVFGNQCIVVGIDVRFEDGRYVVYTHSGTQVAPILLQEHIQLMEKMGAGEIFINSIDHDGMMNGYDHQLIRLVMSHTTLPVIAGGGAGNLMHLVQAVKETKVSALAMASIYHFGDNNPIRARSYLKNNGIQVKSI